MAYSFSLGFQQNRGIGLWKGKKCEYAKRVGKDGSNPHGPSPAQMAVCNEVSSYRSNDRSNERSCNENVHADSAAHGGRPYVGQGTTCHGHRGGPKCTTEEAADHDRIEILSERHRKAKGCKQNHTIDDREASSHLF